MLTTMTSQLDRLDATHHGELVLATNCTSYCEATMKITALSAQVRNPDRVNVSIDGKYKFSLDITQIVDFGIKVGRELTETELVELEQASQFGKLYSSLLEY